MVYFLFLIFFIHQFYSTISLLNSIALFGKCEPHRKHSLPPTVNFTQILPEKTDFIG